MIQMRRLTSANTACFQVLYVWMILVLAKCVLHSKGVVRCLRVGELLTTTMLGSVVLVVQNVGAVTCIQ